MTIPFILEVSLGLVFIYLILSLLASEIQEIIGTLLQWRAEHLKRSIEVLIAANDKDSQAAARAFTDRLYETPLLRSLNQEATGPIAHGFRVINHVIGKIYRTLTRARNVFGEQTSGPSYIPAKTFAQALLENLQIEDLRAVLLESRLGGFVDTQLMRPLSHMVNDLRASTANEFLLNAEFRNLESAIAQLVDDFKAGRTSLAETLDRLISRLDEFMAAAQTTLPDNHHLTETFMRRLRALKRTLASTNLDKAALMKRIQPDLAELVTVVDPQSPIYDELKNIVGKDNGQAQAVLSRLETQTIPPSLQATLVSLANKARSSLAAQASDTVLSTMQNLTEDSVSNIKIYLSDLESDVKSLGQEVEAWFNRGMARAQGVYKRNAKAVALLIGVAIAISLNADSLHILDRLSRDPVIRSAISQAAEEAVVNDPAVLAELEEDIDGALGELPIPLGYSEAVVTGQQAAETTWVFPFIPRRWVGWLITGFAISMGSNFWFNLLKRIVDVKNTGEEEGTKSSQ